MENIINLDHSFIKKEIDNSIVLVLDFQKEWNNKDIQFNLKDHNLQIRVENEPVKWQIKLSNELLIESLKNKITAVIINGGNGGVAEGVIYPLEIRKKNKI